jgi:hypothetical protein
MISRAELLKKPPILSPSKLVSSSFSPFLEAIFVIRIGGSKNTIGLIRVCKNFCVTALY